MPGGTLPALPNGVGIQTLETLLTGSGSPVQALAGGATLSIAGVSAVSTFLPGPSAVPAAPTTPTTSLPRTGGEDSGLVAIAAGLLLVLAMGIRRRVLAPARID